MEESITCRKYMYKEFSESRSRESNDRGTVYSRHRHTYKEKAGECS
jgi:hypothetical protein